MRLPNMVSRSNSLAGSSTASTDDGGDPLDARVCCHDGLGMAKCGVWLFTGVVLWAAGIVILTVEYEHLQGEGLRCAPDLHDPTAPCVNITRWCYFSPSPYTDYSPCNFMTVLGTLAIALPLIGLGITWLFSLILTAVLNHLPASKQGLYHMIYTGLFALGLWLAAVIKFSLNDQGIKQMPNQPPEMAEVQYWRDVASGMAWASIILCVIQLVCAGVVLFIRVRSLYYPSHESIAPLSSPLWTFKRHLDAPHSGQHSGQHFGQHSGQHSFRPSPPLPIALPVLHSNPAFSVSGAPPGAGEQVQGAVVQVQTVAVQPQGAAEQPYLRGGIGVGVELRPMHPLNTGAGPGAGAGMGVGAGEGRMAGTGMGAGTGAGAGEGEGPRMGASVRAGLPGLATPSGGTPTHTQPSTPMSFLDAPDGGPFGAAAGENVA